MKYYKKHVYSRYPHYIIYRLNEQLDRLEAYYDNEWHLTTYYSYDLIDKSYKDMFEKVSEEEAFLEIL